MRHAIDGIAQPDNRDARARRRWRVVLAAAATLLLATVAPLHADQTAPGFTPAQRAEIVAILRHALATDPTILRDAVAALQADDARQQDEASSEAVARLGPSLTANPADPVAGNPHGDVTVVEFYDLHCPYCREMRPIVDALVQADPNVRLVYKDIPVLGPGSTLAARAVLAARQQGGYGRLQSAILQSSGQITEDSLRQAAQSVGLDWPRLRHDMDDPAIRAQLNANLDLARQLGVEGTPAFVVGRHLIPGAIDLAQLQTMVAAARQPAAN